MKGDGAVIIKVICPDHDSMTDHPNDIETLCPHAGAQADAVRGACFIDQALERGA